jgi:hypothetical protein
MRMLKYQRYNGHCKGNKKVSAIIFEPMGIYEVYHIQTIYFV